LGEGKIPGRIKDLSLIGREERIKAPSLKGGGDKSALSLLGRGLG